MARPVVYDDGVRARLLDAAAEHVFAHGLGTLSLRTIAREAGTTTAAVYALFGSKDGLVAGLYERAVTRFTEQLAAAPRRADPRDDLAALGLAYRRSALADPHGYRVMFGGHVDPATLPRHIGAAAAASFAPLFERVHRAQSEGAIAADASAAEVATSLWAHVHGLVVIELGLPRPPLAADPAAFFERSIRALVLGWSPAS